MCGGFRFCIVQCAKRCAKRCAYCRERIFVSFRKLFSFLGIWLLLYVKKLFKGAFNRRSRLCSIEVETALIPNFNDMILIREREKKRRSGDWECSAHSTQEWWWNDCGPKSVASSLESKEMLLFPQDRLPNLVDHTKFDCTLNLSNRCKSFSVCYICDLQTSISSLLLRYLLHQ